MLLSTTALSITVLLSLLAPSVIAQPVTLWLKNGDRISGELISVDDEQVNIETAYAGQLTISRAQVGRSEPSINEPPVRIVAVEPWSLQHELDVTVATRRNESQTDTVGVKLFSELRNQSLRFAVNGQYDYEASNGVSTTHKYIVSPRFDYFFMPKIFWRSKLDYNYNFLNLDYRDTDLSSGVGYSFVDQQQHRAELVLLGGIKAMDFNPTASTILIFGDKSRLEFRFARIEWDWRYPWQDYPMEWYSQGTYSYTLDQPYEYVRYTSDLMMSAGIRYYVTDKIRLSYSWELEQTKLSLVLPGVPDISADSEDLYQKLTLGARF